MKNMDSEYHSVTEKTKIQRFSLELMVILALGLAVYILAGRYDIMERIFQFSKQHENWEFDEIITVCIFFVMALTIYLYRQRRRLLISERELLNSNNELRKALSEIRQLKGIVPICASCMKIRDDKGYWQQVEKYVSDRTEARFSHGICPECEKILYPFLSEDEDTDEEISG